MSIRLKILIALLCTGVIPALSFWVFTETILHKSRANEIHNKLQALSDLKAQLILGKVEHDSEKLALISSRTQMRISLASYLKEGDPRELKRINKILLDAHRSLARFKTITITDLKRQAIVSTDPSITGSTINTNQAIQNAISGSVGFSYIIDPNDEDTKITRQLCAPLIQDDQIIGLIIAQTDFDETYQNIDQSAGFGGKGRTTLVKMRGDKIIRSLIPLLDEGEPITFTDKNGKDISRFPMYTKKHVFTDKRSGSQHMLSLSRVENSDLAVITDIQKDVALRSTNQLITFARFVGILSIISILLVSVFFARTLSMPLRKVAQTARRIAGGDLDARAPATTHDEVGLLAQSFNRMTGKLVDANRNLEKKVEQRTAQLKTTEKLLIQSEKLESLGRMAAGVAHEVKNPLFVIQSGLDFFGMTLKNSDDATSKTLTLMDEAVQRANSIVLGLLELSRSEEFNLQPEDINELVEKSIILIDHGLTEKSIFLERDLDRTIPKVMLDFHKLEQVLINLLDNAIHATPKGGTITVKTYTKQLAPVKRDEGIRHFDRLREDDEVAVIEVMNTGSHIDEDKMRKLFDPFFTTKPSNVGTGLGLAVCKTIIDLHNGSIRIENMEIPEGVRVSVTLKIRNEELEKQTQNENEPRD